MLTTFALLMLGLFLWATRKVRLEQPFIPANPVPAYQGRVPGVVVRPSNLDRAMKAREAVRGDAGYVLRR